MMAEKRLEISYLEGRRIRNPLEFADRLQPELHLKEEAEEQVRYILKAIKLDSPYHSEVLKKRTRACNSVLANLLASAWYGVPIRYYRKKNIFSNIPFKPDWYSYRTIIPIFDGLKKHGWIKEIIGFQGEYRSYLTRALPTEQLVDFFQNNSFYPSSLILEYIPERVIRLKEYNSDQEIRYVEDDFVTRMKEEIIEYNEMIDSKRIDIKVDLSLLSSPYQDIIYKGLGRGRIFHSILSFESPKKPIFSSSISQTSKVTGTKSLPFNGNGKNSQFTLTHEHIYRVFKGSWDKGGRFYGPLYQHFSEEMRSYLLIDGMPTIEKDFIATNLSISFNLAEYQMETDPYLRLNINSTSRNTYKKVANCVLFSHSRSQALYALKKIDFEWEYANYLIDMFEIVFPELRPFFYQGKKLALKLQNIDSEILRGVIKSLLRENILPLVIHDSMIVQKKYSEKLKEIMKDEWGRVLYEKTGKMFEPMIK